MSLKTGGSWRRVWRKLRHRKLKWWHLLLIMVLSSAGSVYFMRQNNLQMVRLRNQVIAADESNANVVVALKKLNQHVFGHMNTRIVEPIQLVGTYGRRAQAIIESSQQQSQTANRDLYAEAATACATSGQVWTEASHNCVISYINQNNGDFGAQPDIVLPDKSQFIYTFSSPKWTPDLAGFSLIIASASGLLLLLRLLEYLLVGMVVRRRHRQQF